MTFIINKRQISLLFALYINHSLSMFSNSLKYSIKALSFLASNSDVDHKFNIRYIAKKSGVPPPYLGKLLQLMSKNGIVTSIKGPSGGFYLSEENKQIKLAQVVYLIDGKEKFTNCALNFNQCDLENPCPLHQFYYPLNSKFLKEIGLVLIADLAKEK